MQVTVPKRPLHAVASITTVLALGLAGCGSDDSESSSSGEGSSSKPAQKVAVLLPDTKS